MSNETKDKALHHGHRQRMMKKYERLGSDAFENHELVEMLLFYGIAGKNTNDIAHQLLNDSGDIYHMLRSSIDKLTETKGIGTKNALLVKLCNDIVRASEMSNLSSVPLDNEYRRQRYITAWYANQESSTVMAMFLTKKLMLIESVLLSQGRKRRCSDYSAVVLETAQKLEASYVILTHNHSDNCPEPSDNDIYLTGDIRVTLAKNGISLLDHYIVTDHDCSPLSQYDARRSLFNEKEL
ncbi:MAG: RadC family protein [Clostridia bacterium]|nr:RadC family protein [Clostridia bacterium]